ncbi:MAG: hypothetical protein ACHWZW_10230 [Spirulina sp.]
MPIKKLTKLIVLTCISSTFTLGAMIPKHVSAHHAPSHFIADLSEAMENASDTCEAALPSSMQSGQGIVAMVRSNCAVMVRHGYEALQKANLSPRGYNLATDSGFMRYMAAADRILSRDAAFMTSILTMVNTLHSLTKKKRLAVH